jgi:hypothetical protein
MNEIEILQLITKSKDARGLSDEAWAEFLGISWGWWSKVKNGQRQLTAKVLAKIAARCPEIDLRVLEYMRQKGGE